MPARTVDLLHRFLRQHEGRLSKRARARDFSSLTDGDVSRIERLFENAFASAHPPPDAEAGGDAQA